MDTEEALEDEDKEEDSKAEATQQQQQQEVAKLKWKGDARNHTLPLMQRFRRRKHVGYWWKRTPELTRSLHGRS